MVWQLLLLVLGTSWLLAPHLNHVLSYRTTLISQYEATSQPYAWLFRLCDIGAASLLLYMAWLFVKSFNKKIAGYLLALIGFGLLIDPLVTTTCTTVGGICHEYMSGGFVIHAANTVVTAAALFLISVYDSWLRKRLVSISFVVFQLLYIALFVTQLASHDNFNTASQYIYQTVIIVWLAWFCRDFVASQENPRPSDRESTIVKSVVAVWAFLNGILAILISLAHLHLFGKIRGLYFGGDSAWLAQHGVIVGVVMLYLSRQLARGDLRARQLFLFIVGLETIKYSVIAPNPILMLAYFVTFCALFVLRDDFDIGLMTMTLKVRLKDALFMLSSLGAISLVALGILYRTHKLADITRASFDNFFDYILHSQILTKTEVKSALLAHTIAAFSIASIAVILWILFRPYGRSSDQITNFDEVEKVLSNFSDSSEDYFKLWPADKNYFWQGDRQGFVAYKIVGPIAFALADPISSQENLQNLLLGFTTWCRARRLRACFLPIYPSSKQIYEQADYTTLQIGASALIDTHKFLNVTVNDKWWRWRKNKAAKSGYIYKVSTAPHAVEVMSQLKLVSEAWLGLASHEERSFALGYFDEAYLQKCQIHYLTSSAGQLVAFANQLPTFAKFKAATIDLLRYNPEADDSMPFLLFKTIENLANDGYSLFDLGFVPFAATKGRVQTIAKVLSAGRFSAKGLEQFKNKFDPDWQPNFMAYDGDLADLALIAANLEKAMSRD